MQLWTGVSALWVLGTILDRTFLCFFDTTYTISWYVNTIQNWEHYHISHLEMQLVAGKTDAANGVIWSSACTSVLKTLPQKLTNQMSMEKVCKYPYAFLRNILHQERVKGGGDILICPVLSFNFYVNERHWRGTSMFKGFSKARRWSESLPWEFCLESKLIEKWGGISW